MRLAAHEELAARLRRCQGDDLPKGHEAFTGSRLDFMFGAALAAFVICVVVLVARAA